jgi:FkbM family methyltransferase
MCSDPGAERLAALRAEARSRELLDLEVGGVKTRFYDQGGRLADCHRIGVFYEAAMLNRIAELGREGVYVDVGANVGNHTAFFAQHCPSTSVHAFEPLDFVSAILAENVAVNELTDKVVIHRFGLGETPGRVTVKMGKRTYSFGCRRLDDVMAGMLDSAGVSGMLDCAGVSGPLAVLKVDIEGMEVPFFRGAAETLRRERPLIYVEAGTAPEFAALRSLLAELDYRPTGLRFNATATYEFAPVGDPLLARRPARRPDRRPTRRAARRLVRRLRRGLSGAWAMMGRRLTEGVLR